MTAPKMPSATASGKRAKTGGRVKGTPNKATAEARQAIAELLDMAAPQMIDWLGRVAKNDPAKALDIVLRAAEYHIPKLARTELTGADGRELAPPQFIVQPVAPKPE